MTAAMTCPRRFLHAGSLIAATLIAASVWADGPPSPKALLIGSGEKSIERYAEYGYTAAILGDATQLASYDEVFPNAIPPGSDLRNRIEQERKRFQRDCDRAKTLGIAVCLMTDEVSMPSLVLERLKRPASTSELSARIDFASDEFWKVYRAKYREVLKAYPRIAWVIIRTGENYSHPEKGFIGHTVLDGKYDEAYFRNMTRLIEESRKVVVDECGRRLIWRTWDLGNDGFHANPKVYDRVLAALPSREGLIFSLKHTQTDFWRYNDFNPMIGRGGLPQIVEFQCAREYEGKGAFPNYVGPLFSEDMRKAAAISTVKGFWIWDFAGGWGGPHLKSDRWVRLNITAASRLAQNPDTSPRQIAEEWATKEFGAKAATNITEMLMLSSECVRKSMYIEPFALEHKGWKPSLNLMRDDIIRGEALRQLYEGSRKSLPGVYAEKEQAVALAERMRSLFEHSHSDIVAERGERVYAESLSSLLYLENLAVVMRHYVNGMFRFYYWQETGDTAAAAKAREELLAWRKAWTRHQTEVPNLPGVASIYRSQNRTQNPTDVSSTRGAMAELCEAALQTLASKTTSPPATQAVHNPAAAGFQSRN